MPSGEEHELAGYRTLYVFNRNRRRPDRRGRESASGLRHVPDRRIHWADGQARGGRRRRVRKGDRGKVGERDERPVVREVEVILDDPFRVLKTERRPLVRHGVRDGRPRRVVRHRGRPARGAICGHGDRDGVTGLE
jgi:hypothetical protein